MLPKPFVRLLLLGVFTFVGCVRSNVNVPAEDSWTVPAPGVRLLERTTKSPAWRIHVAEVQLDTPGLTLRSTASTERKQTVSAFAQAVGAQLAINADFFSYDDYSTEGLAAGDGAAWPGAKDTTSRGVFVFGEQRVELEPARDVVTFDPSWMRGAVSGKPELVRDGKPRFEESDGRCFNVRHPRTALGLSRDEKRLLLVVVDGRSETSVGMTCSELAALMAELGAWSALNLDGGGSSELYEASRGVINTPSDGRERPTANHLAVLLPQTSLVVIEGVVLDGDRPLSRALVKVESGARTTSRHDGTFSLLSTSLTTPLTVTRPGFTTAQIVFEGTHARVTMLRRQPMTDTDGDGVLDDVDDCATTPDAQQLDTDRDGEGDACDADDDSDGVPDEDDRCPLVRGPPNHEGCP